MSWFNRKPKHKHTPRALRVSRFTVTRTDDVYVTPGGPTTRVSWKCTTCGATWHTDKPGNWEVEDFR